MSDDSLPEAYRHVIASRFSDRAIYYRLVKSIREADTPMAALVLPVLDPRASGVLHTRDLSDQAASQMILNAVWGLAARLMSGQTESDTLVANRSDPERLLRRASGR